MNGSKSHEEIAAEEKSKLETALTEIEILKNKNKNLKRLVQICDEREYEDRKEIIGLKTQLEEANKVEDTLLQQMKEKSVECDKLEEVLCLRKKLEKAQRELLINTSKMKSSG